MIRMVVIKNRGEGDLRASAAQCLVDCTAISAIYSSSNHTLIINVMAFVKK